MSLVYKIRASHFGQGRALRVRSGRGSPAWSIILHPGASRTSSSLESVAAIAAHPSFVLLGQPHQCLLEFVLFM